MPTIIDWPATASFVPRDVRFGAATPKSAFAGFYTGQVQSVGHLADRLRCTLTLPPCGPVEGQQREAFFLGLASTGDWLRLGHQHRIEPAGNARGALVTSAAAVAGARTLNLAGATAGANLLRYSGFELDTNGDGLADGLTLDTGGVTGTITCSRGTGLASTYMQQIAASALAAGAVAGARFAATGPAPFAGQQVAVSIDVNGWGATSIIFQFNWYTAADVYISSGTAVLAMPSSWSRLSSAFTAPAGAAKMQFIFYVYNGSGGLGYANFDNAQLEFGAVPTLYAGLPTLQGGDMLSVGNQLLMVAYPGATFNDAGVGVVPLVLPLAQPVASGASVSWQAPSGTFQLAGIDGMDVGYGRGRWQSALEINLQQAL